MLANQLYYDFSREVERLKTNMYATNSTLNKDTQVLTRQLIQLRETMEFRNREIEKRLNDLRRLVQSFSGEKTY